MSAQQLASFPGFITGIENSLENVDSYHVGVITSDNDSGNEPGCKSLGDLVTQTSGFNSSNMVCGPLSSGLRFATDEWYDAVIAAKGGDVYSATRGSRRASASPTSGPYSRPRSRRSRPLATTLSLEAESRPMRAKTC